MKKCLLLSAALFASLGVGAQIIAQLEDVTPSGYDFSKYEDGAVFKVHPALNAGWSPMDGIYDAAAMAADGHFTVFARRGAESENTEEQNAKDQPSITIRDFGGYIGKCLVINEAWSPLASATVGGQELYGEGNSPWPSIATGGCTNVQLGFYADPAAIQHGWGGGAVRVRLVFNLLRRGRHAASDGISPYGRPISSGAAGMEENANTYRPYEDGQTGVVEIGYDASYFARWENEGTCLADMPAEPKVLSGTDVEDPFDGAGQKNDLYLMQLPRFMVLEFDTYSVEPANAIKALFNFANANMSIIIKEIKFFNIKNPLDLLGPSPDYTPIKGSSYLGDRVVSYRYYTEEGVKEFDAGVGQIEIDDEDANAAPVYYNLYGVRIENPSNGLYIVKRGNKVTKEIVR